MIVNELLEPNSIVVVGGSNDIEKPGGKVLKNLLDGKYDGKLSVVNPKESIVQGITCFNDVNKLENTDLAIIAIASKFVLPTIETLAKEKNTKAFILLSAGFSEIGEQGKILEDQIVKVCNKYGASLIGPNCIGVLSPKYKGVFAGPIPKLASSGIDFVTGSGATAVFILETAIEMGLTFASVYSVGNSAQIGVEEVLKHWDETFDENSSKVKIIYIEKIDKPDLLLKHSRSLIAKGCKIAAIKAGTTEAGSRAVSSHTGALAGSDTAVDALFKKAGIVRCFSREELVYVAGAFCYKQLTGNRIAVITHAGGPGVMLTDALSKGYMQVPHISGNNADELLSKLFYGSSVSNPIDFIATGTAEQLGIILDYVDDKFDNIDGSVVIFGTTGLFDVTEVYKVLDSKIKNCKKPIYPVLPSIIQARKEVDFFLSLGRINFPDEVNLGNALSKIFHTKTISEFVEEFKTDVATIRKIVENAPNGYLSPEDNIVLLDAVGIPRAKEFVVDNLDLAKKAAQDSGYPLVLKVIGPVHKSDVGGVVLNVDTVEKLENEFNRLMQIPDSTGVLIQPMLSGLELFIGAKREAQFGHIVLCGLGGIFIEVLKDVSHCLVPVSKSEAKEMIQNLKSYKLLQGIRGTEGVDENLYAEIICKVSALLTAAPEISEMDINPLLGKADSIVAVDVRICIEK